MKRRGSVIIYMLFLITAATAIAVVYADLTNSISKTQAARERAYQASCAMDDALLSFNNSYVPGTTSIPTSTNTLQLGAGLTTDTTINVSDNAAAIPRTFKAVTTCTISGHTYRQTVIFGKRDNPIPNSYALCVNGEINSAYAISVSDTDQWGTQYKNEASVYTGGALRGAGSLSTVGDLEYVGSKTMTSVTAVREYAGASPFTFPNPNTVTYTSGADVVWGGDQTVSFFLFLVPMIYISGVGSLSGTVVGTGTISASQIQVVGDITYTGKTDFAAWISMGNFAVNASTTRIDGNIFCGGTFTTSGPLTINGTLATKDLVLGGPLTINYSGKVWRIESLANTLRLPGRWP